MFHLEVLYVQVILLCTSICAWYWPCLSQAASSCVTHGHYYVQLLSMSMSMMMVVMMMMLMMMIVKRATRMRTTGTLSFPRRVAVMAAFRAWRQDVFKHCHDKPLIPGVDISPDRKEHQYPQCKWHTRHRTPTFLIACYKALNPKP